MGIIDEVKERLDIVEVISGYVSLKKAGRNYKGLCPFHTEKTPSFVVFPDTQSWHCFGACGTGGDVFSFVARQENVEFPEALEILARRAGIELKPQTDVQKTEADLERRLEDINKLAASYYHNQLIATPAGEAARRYLAKRGLNQETIDRFQLGCAPDAWHALDSYLGGKNVQTADLLKSGLVVARDDGDGHYDRFRNRIMIPIRDHTGHVIGFGGRVLDDSQPKYLNTPETPIFQKGHVLFGIDLAKAAIRAEDKAIVVEGYMDVIQAHQHGASNVVAAMGTALTEMQVKMLRKYARTIVLALDPDTAGGHATLRGLDLSRRITLHEVVNIGQALVESQYSSEADVRIAVLPPGQDPDDLIRDHPESWTQLIDSALPVIEYYLQLMKDQFDLQSAQGKTQAADQLLPVIRDIENPIQRSHYLQKLSRLIQVDEKLLQEQLRIHKRRKVGQEEAWQTARDIRSTRPAFELEEHCLMALVARPSGLAAANQALSDLGLSPFGLEDFSRTENQHLFAAMERFVSDSVELTVEVIRADLAYPIIDHLDRLLAYWATLPPVSEDRAEGEAVSAALKLRQQVTRRRCDELYGLLRDAETEHDSVACEEYGKLVEEQRRSTGLLQQAVYAGGAVSGQRRTTRTTGRYGVIEASLSDNDPAG
jgi:DNA primase